MNYLSVCSGIEAATVAWHDMGWNPVGFSEIEKFPSQLLQHHYPNVTNFGDMTKYKDWNINESVELLVGGTPCQSFSVAGLRKGLEDPRGNLMLTYLGIADRFKPKWLLWENVSGVLTSNGGKDFACFLQGLAELGYGFAYRVFDAQHFGVPQRRKRVFVVGCFGNWRSAAKVLFEFESLCRDITPSRQEKKETSNSFVSNIKKSVGAIDLKSISKTLTASYGTGGADLDIKPLVLEPNITYGFEPGITKREGEPNRFVKEMTPTLRAQMGDNQIAMINQYAVRRLTPIECERLQGFPDNYTNTPTSSDTTRYKALGNSMAVPVMKWIGERINNVAKQMEQN